MKIYFTMILSVYCTMSWSQLSFHKTFHEPRCEKGRVCISGHLPKDTIISLLDLKNQKICHGRVESNDTYFDEAISFKRSILKELKGCTDDLKVYRDAASVKAARLSVVSISDSWREVSLPEKEMNKFLNEAVTVEGWFEGIKKPFTVSSFEKITSEKVSLKGTNLALTRSSFHQKGKIFASGALILQGQKEFYPVSDLCAQEKGTTLFTLDEKLFLKTDSYCCHCGWSGRGYYRVKSDSVERVSIDSSLST